MNHTRAARLRSLGLLLALAPLVATALEVKPTVTVGEIYTSNVDLAPSGQEDDAWVTRIAPRVDIKYDGPALELGVDYTLEALLYAGESDRNEVYNQLNSSALLDIVGKDLQMRGAVILDQVNVAPERPVSNSNINTTGNRGNATTWNLGPQWRHDVLGNSEVDGYATYGHVNYDAAGSQDVDTINGRMSLHTSPRLNPTLTYELAYEYDELQYQVSGDTVVQTAYLQLGYQANSTLQLFVLGGLDNDIENPNDSSLNEPRWETGFSTNFGANRIRASFGHRYFGPTYSFSWDLKQADSTYRVSYSEAPTTSDLTAISELPTDPTSAGTPGTPPPDSTLGRPGNPTRFVLKRGDALGSWTLYRTEFSLGVFWEDRHDEVLAGDNVSSTSSLDNEQSYGANVGLRWEIGAKSIASLAATWRHRTYNDLTDSSCDALSTTPCSAPSDDDELSTLTAGLDYALGLKTGLGFRTGWQRRTGTSASTNDYDEYWASVQLVRTF